MNPSFSTDRNRIALAALVATVCASAVATYLGLSNGWPRPEVLFWLVVCMVGELLWVRLPVDRVTISMAACFQLAAMLVLHPAEAMLAAALSGFVSELLFVRKPVVRALYNAAQSSLAVAAGAAAFSSLAGSVALPSLKTVPGLLPFVAAGAAYYVVNRGAVALAVALSNRLRFADAWRRNFGSAFDLIGFGSVLSLGVLLAATYARLGAGAAAFVLLPLILVCQGYRRAFERGAESLPEYRRKAA